MFLRRTIMKRFLRSLLLAFLWIGLAAAQTAVVTRNVNLRPDASTDNTPIEKLRPPAQVQLIAPDATAGYFHVKAADGQTGFVWGKNISISTPSSNGSTSTSAGSTGLPLSGQALFDALIAKRKTAVGQPLVENGSMVCGPTGDSTKAAPKSLNTNKNRTDLPGDADYVQISWDDLATLPKSRVKDFQGAPVTVVGFLSHQVKVENGGESTNCHLHADPEVDWHIYLTKSPAQGIKDAVIVETTPRTRPSHKWTTDMLSPLVDSQTRVRISGWLMYDSEHVGVIGTQRATVWEVHPITRIQVQQNGQWVDLDAQQ
jgi:hypothetical protein